jgi:hypothetical protein
MVYGLLRRAGGSRRRAIARLNPRKKSVKFADCVASALLVHMGVDLQRDRDPRVPEDHHRVTRRHAELLKERGCHVAQIVQPDRPQLRRPCDALE